MTSTHGMTVDQGVARVMEAERIPDERERRQEYRKILEQVRRHAYTEGSDDERSNHWD